MIYRHTKTGAIITTSNPISGDWELVEAPKPEPPVQEPETAPEKKRRVKKG